MARKRTDPRLAVAYLRISTEEEKQRTSYRVQVATIAAWAAQEGIEVVSWHRDDVSTRKPLAAREGFWEAMGALEASRAGVLVVSTLLRLCRDPEAYAEIAREVGKRGAVILTADGQNDAQGTDANFFRGMRLLLGQHERDKTRDRIKAALRDKRARGEIVGQAPYGMRRIPGTNRLEPDPYEQFVITEIMRMREAGYSLDAITRALLERGYVGRPLPPGTPGPNGEPPKRPGGGPARPLNRSQVYRILQRLGLTRSPLEREEA